MTSIINVSIHSDLSEFPTEKRYSSDTKVSELKKKLELITGANHTSMKIMAAFTDTQQIELANDEETLAHYVGEHAKEGTTINLIVKDDRATDPLSGDVPKYTIDDAKYLERKDNARNFIKELREKRLSSE